MKINFALISRTAFLSGLIFFACLISARAQTTAFTYQGKLSDGAAAASGIYDLGFALYDAETGGTQIGAAITRSNVTVAGGIFTVQLDFGASAFPGANRFLQIAVKKTSEADFTTLTPRQQLTSSPYSIRTISAGVADALSANCVGCVTNAQINGVDGAKVSGTVAKATNAGNVTGIVAIANGGTGSATKNFVDLSTNQTIGGGKTFSNAVTANAFSAGSGGLNMNGNTLRLRDSADNNHGMVYNTTVDGPEFRAFGGFRWTNGTAGATQRMNLDSSGNLSVSGNLTSANVTAGNITATGTITGTLGSGSVTTASFSTLPSCRARQTEAQTLTNAVFIGVRLDDTQFCSGVTFDNSNDRLVIVTPGVYLINADIIFAVNATGIRTISVLAAGNEAGFRTINAVSGIETGVAADTLIRLNAGDYVSFRGGQSSGGNLNTNVYNGRSASLSVAWVGP